jgi:hypothetical protein
LIDQDGNDFILELNDTAIGLNQNFETEDTERIVQLVLSNLNKLFSS